MTTSCFCEWRSEWQRDEANLSGTARRFFGEGILDEPTKLLQKLLEASVTPETGRYVLTGAAGGSLAGVPSITLAGAGAGFAIGIVFRGIGSWAKARRAAKESPLRYLTFMQDQGVSFSVSR